MGATLINVFIVPRERHDEFLATWKETAAHYQHTAGLIETHLHRNTDVGDDTFSFINIARWTSGQAWRDAHDLYIPKEYSIPGVKGHPSIFETTVNIYSDDITDGVDRDHWIASIP